MKSEATVAVLLAVPSMRAGGAERLVSIMSRELDRSRFSVALALMAHTGELLATIPSDVAVHELGKRGAWSLPALVLRMRSLLKRTRPDVVIGFMTYSNLVLLAAAERSGVPVIATEHSRPRSAGRRRRRRARQWAARLLYPRAARVVAVSDGVRRELIELYQLQPDRVVTIHNPLEPSIRAGGRSPVGNRDLRVLSVGRLSSEKGHRFLIDAIAPLVKSPRVTLTLVGDGPERSSLERQAGRLGVDDRITFLGYQAEPFSAAAADVFVLPSLREGFAMALVEAMQAGLPVIAADCQFGPAEIIDSEVSGLLVPPGDADALRDALVRVSSETGLAERLSEAGRRRASDFAVERIIPQYEKLIREVAARWAHPGG